MLAKVVLLSAFACSAIAAPYEVTNPEDLKNNWYSNDYSATRGVNEKIHWKFTLEGHNAVPDPGDFSVACHGVQNGAPCGKTCAQKTPFTPCKDTSYEARQYFNGPKTTIEVRRTTMPDFGKKVITSANVNITAQMEVGTVTYGLLFGEFQKQFISTLNEPPSS
ncbi:hypothetical protein FAUST_5223 [Fusarium austroamericanum]|uniref:Uncharacterized protein n=1 Tax=Fusarium austroamericanum TaxID=282268 RepID=A0AAN6HFR4_FUSAU|nr:hypothetical protein FAUST_5223 [Fusarium austroamericanum]